MLRFGVRIRFRPRISALPRSVSTVVRISGSSMAFGAIMITGLDGRYGISLRDRILRGANVSKAKLGSCVGQVLEILLHLRLKFVLSCWPSILLVYAYIGHSYAL